MPEKLLPIRYQHRKKALLVLLYLATAYAGFSALIWTPVTISGSRSMGFTLAWASLMLLTSLTAIYGVVRTNKAVVEHVSVWFMGISILGYITTVWLLVADTPSRQTQAALCTGLLIALVNRAFDLAVATSRQRKTVLFPPAPPAHQEELA